MTNISHPSINIDALGINEIWHDTLGKGRYRNQLREPQSLQKRNLANHMSRSALQCPVLVVVSLNIIVQDLCINIVPA